MRGKAVTASSNRSCRRITPAHAGKSEITEAAAAAGKDHPRPCGEKYNISPTVFALVGSPPPMRGKVAGYARTVEITGITPAHAGKSHVYLLYARAGRDHPRPCGEKFDHELQRTRLIGSPPPMRGKENGPKPRKYTHRITPAHAGKRAAVKGNSPLKQDHPRPCGEKGGTAMAKYTATGSPPPMRGKARVGKTARYTSRITPAHAGKRLRKRRNTGIFVFQISRFHLVSHTPDTSYGNRPALYVRRLPRTPAALQASKAYDRARWAAYAWLFAVCPHTGS